MASSRSSCPTADIPEKESGKNQTQKEKEDSTQCTEVHSANSWEKAELGDNDRKMKFLKLMGANKKQHSGRFVIGDGRTDHGRTKEENEELTENIEGLYSKGLQHKLTGAARRHTGLGFQPDDAKTADANDGPGEPESEVTESGNPCTRVIGFCKATTDAGESEEGVDDQNGSTETRGRAGETEIESREATAGSRKREERVTKRSKDKTAEKRSADSTSDGDTKAKAGKLNK